MVVGVTALPGWAGGDAGLWGRPLTRVQRREEG